MRQSVRSRSARSLALISGLPVGAIAASRGCTEASTTEIRNVDIIKSLVHLKSRPFEVGTVCLRSEYEMEVRDEIESRKK